MAEIHSPDIYGPIALAAAPGTAGQHLESAGAGAQAVWASTSALISSDTPNLLTTGGDGRLLVSGNSVPNLFTFTSAIAAVHTITHNLGNQFPVVTVYDTATGAVVVPTSVVGTNVNTLTITFFVPVAIAGSVVG
jgi:hypothetical protein